MLNKKSKSFVIGDIPVIRYPSSETSLDSPEARLIYPVSWDVLIVWGLHDRDKELLFLSDDSYVRSLNETSLKQSNIIAGRSETLIRSLAHSRHGSYRGISS